VAINSILRRISSPLLQVGDLAFDSEVSVQRGLEVEYTQNRIGAGVDLSDHSFVKPRVYTITGAIAGISASSGGAEAPRRSNVGAGMTRQWPVNKYLSR